MDFGDEVLKFLKIRTSIDLRVETIGYRKLNLRKKWDIVRRVYYKSAKIPEFFQFLGTFPILDPFLKCPSIRNTKGSGSKLVATGSVSKRYQTILVAQLFKNGS